MLFKRLIQLPGTYVPAHVSLWAGNANVAQCVLQVQKFLKYNQARAQLLQPVPLEGTLLQSKELCLGKSIWIKEHLSPWWEGELLVLLTFLSSKGGRKTDLDPSLPPGSCDRSRIGTRKPSCHRGNIHPWKDKTTHSHEPTQSWWIGCDLANLV